ncbi:MAG: PBP1A family penicillin-binding protein [Polyangia bacterium]
MNHSGSIRKRTAGRRKPRSGVRTALKRAVLVVLFLGLGGAAGLAAAFYALSLDLPAIGPLLEGYDPPQKSRILAADGTVIGELFEERRTVVPLERIPRVMRDAVIAAEDADFLEHRGIDYLGMVRALMANLSERRLAQGASTITQQVARTFFLSREKTFARKIREILLTRRIEDRLTKEEILFLYLNQINFGHARYGVHEAAAYYFDRDVEDLGLAEAALLAGIPKGPAIYDPFDHPEAAKKRRRYVLGEMKRHEMISEAEAELAETAPLDLTERRGPDSELAPEAISRALEELADVVDPRTLRHGGYTIETTIVPGLQRAARRALREGLQEIDERHGRIAPFEAGGRKPRGSGCRGGISPGKVYAAKVVERDDSTKRLVLEICDRRGYLSMRELARYNPDDLPPSRFAERGAFLRVSAIRRPDGEGPVELQPEIGPQGALAAVDPSTGRILALVGGDRGRPGGFDRASDARRQPGSAFKPFVYIEAIRSRRYTAATMLDDSPEVDGNWRPGNHSAEGLAGAVPLRDALSRSLNLPAVKTIRELGPGRVVELAHAMGIRSRLEESPALALGASAVSPLEMASAYATLAAGGVYRPPRVVARATNPDGREIPLVGRSERRVLAEEEAYLATSLLESVIGSGTGRRARALGRPAAGKTGTSNEMRDAWFVGYTPNVAAAVWVGYSDFRPIGRREYGSRAALPIWLRFMQAAHRGRPERDFERPEGVVTAKIDPRSGLLAYEGQEETVEEIFIEGTRPTARALPPEVVSLDDFLLEQASVPDGGPGAERDAGPQSAGSTGEN